jgi:PAS domain S-box-containing protein
VQVFTGDGNSGTPAPWVAGPIWIAFGLVLLTLAVVGTASYRSTNQLASSSAWVAHTQTVILGLEGLRDVIDGAESAERGYILRGDRTLLEMVATARPSAARIMKSQGELTADNPAQQRRLLELEPLIEARISLLENATAIRTRLGRDAATVFIEEHNGPALMKVIHARVETMIDVEDELLKQRGLAEREGAQFTLRVLGVGALAALFFVALAAVYIQRTIARLRQATELAQQRTDELARSESALRAQSAFQKSVFEAAPNVIVMINRLGLIEMVNVQAEAVFGYSREEMVGKPVEMLLPERFRRNHPNLRNSFFEAPTSRPMGAGRDLYGLKKDGSEFPVEIGLNPIETDKGPMVLSAIVDISARKRAQRTDALLAALIDATQYAIMTMRADRTVLTWNPGAEKLYGYSAEEMIGRNAAILNQPGTEPEEGNLLMSRLVGGGGTEQFEISLRRKDGTVIEVAAAMSPIRDARGEVFAISSISYDITDRKRAQQQLLARTEELTRSNAELEQFAYVASHDLQEPLRMVASYVQLIQQRYTGRLDSDADEFINFAVDGATRMKQLINDLLLYSRAGRAAKSVPVEMAGVVDRVMDILQLAIEDAHANVTHDGLPQVMGDEGGLYEVMQNLISNALKFRAERPPEVHIGCERRGGDWLFSVRDNGIGIAAEYGERIFAMFQRLHGREEYAGTGIGLAISKRVVERHRGKIWMESAPGDGSTFFFTLPAALEEQTSESSS